VAVVSRTDVPFERRSAAFDVTALPVPAELLVYTEDEWRALISGGSRFARTLESEVRWL
jgi:hypothetical protein